MLKYDASHLAAASILLSNKLLRIPIWTPAMVRDTKKTEAELEACAKEMCTLLENAGTSELQAIHKKYSKPKRNSVAKINFYVPLDAQDATSISGGASAPQVRED